RKNYSKADNINYLDGDYASNINDTSWKSQGNVGTKAMYNYSVTSLLTDSVRVFKGGNWKDAAYLLSPATRRYMDQQESSDYVGFRCAMTRVGGSIRGGR
ncbi:MAG: gliding motility lipoprotein GldJ, partial [Bacteroidota bacterium]